MLAGLAFMGNGLDLSVVSFAVPGCAPSLDLTPAEIGYILPMSGIGQLIGAIGVGSLADRIGRRLAFVLSGCLAGAGVGLAASSPESDRRSRRCCSSPGRASAGSRRRPAPSSASLRRRPIAGG